VSVQTKKPHIHPPSGQSSRRAQLLTSSSPSRLRGLTPLHVSVPDRRSSPALKAQQRGHRSSHLKSARRKEVECLQSAAQEPGSIRPAVGVYSAGSGETPNGVLSQLLGSADSLRRAELGRQQRACADQRKMSGSFPPACLGLRTRPEYGCDKDSRFRRAGG
jgi:hypothetical protein